MVPAEAQPSTTPQIYARHLSEESIREWISSSSCQPSIVCVSPEQCARHFGEEANPPHLSCFTPLSFGLVCYAAVVTGTGHQQEGAWTGS